MYYDYNISEYSAEDVGALSMLWSETFGDSQWLVGRFFELLPSMGTGFAAKSGNELVGGAYLLEARLYRKHEHPLRVGYIYAVAVEPEARSVGIGAELVRTCKRHAWEIGYDIVCTLPSEPSLYNWYSAVGGFEPNGGVRYEEIEAKAYELEIHELHADEYGFRRSDILRGSNYVNLLYGWLLFQQDICKELGGGYFSCGDAIACVYVEGDTLLVKEVLGETPEFIPALCAKLGAKKAIARRAAIEGEPYITAYSLESYPADTVFNLTLD